jgi:STE24 endopeptidase
MPSFFDKNYFIYPLTYSLMSSQVILFIILSITAFGYAFEQILDFLNLKSQRTDIPEEIASFYDKDKYLKSLAYHRELTRFSFFTSTFSFLLSACMLWFGVFGWVDAVLRESINDQTIHALIFFGILMLAGDVLTMPFQWYSTFVIEAKYGFNKTTIRTFITDKLKGYALMAIVGGVLMTTLLYLIQILGANFWIWFSVIAAVFVLVVNMFYTSLILPLFNKLTPLPDGELKSAIENFAAKVRFPLDNIFVIDGSKRSSKANAFFSGIGARKKIVLYDTLIQQHTTEELVAVLAHEVGHFKKKHIVLSYILSVIQIVFTMYLLSLMINNEDLSFALGGAQHSIPLNLIAFGILFTPISAITGLLMHIISRKNEFEADAYARDTFDGSALALALKRLSVENLSNLYPHPVYVFFHYSHPPLLQRLKALSAHVRGV